MCDMFQLCDIISGLINTTVNILGMLSPAINDMKREEIVKFNKQTLVNDRVKYFVWSGDCTESMVNPLFL
jgi:hypothetical protein